MKEFVVKITQENQLQEYRVVDTQTDKCEFEVYSRNHLVAVYEPHEDEYIHICRNPGGLDEEVIIMIAERIEAHYL